MLKRWQFWVGILISAACIYFMVRDMKLREAWEALQTAQYLWLIPGIAVYFVGVWARAWRWHYLLRPLKKISTNSMFPIVTIGYMGNNIYPARAGEILRAAVLKNREGVPISASLATIIVERIFDGVVMLSFVFFNLSALTNLTTSSGLLGNVRDLTLWTTVLFFGALFVFLLAAMFPKVTERIAAFFINRFLPVRLREKSISITQRFLEGLESLRSPLDVLMIFVTTFVIWLLETAKYWFVMHAFSFNLSFFSLMLLNGVGNLATTIPSAPGYVGTFDATGVAVLTAYGIAPEIALGYMTVLHVALWFPVTVVGAYFYFRQPLRWGKDLEALRKEGAVSEQPAIDKE